jgi:hypothetical protein
MEVSYGLIRTKQIAARIRVTRFRYAYLRRGFPDPGDRDHGIGNLKNGAANRDFTAIERRLHGIEQQHAIDTAYTLRLKRLGDKGLRAAIRYLQGNKLTD